MKYVEICLRQLIFFQNYIKYSWIFLIKKRTLYTFLKVLKKRDKEKNGTSIKYGKDGKEKNGNEVIIVIIIHKHYKKSLQFLSTNHPVPPGIIVRITSKYFHVRMSSSLICSYVLERKEATNRIFPNEFQRKIYLNLQPIRTQRISYPRLHDLQIWSIELLHVYRTMENISGIFYKLSYIFKVEWAKKYNVFHLGAFVHGIDLYN